MAKKRVLQRGWARGRGGEGARGVPYFTRRTPRVVETLLMLYVQS